MAYSRKQNQEPRTLGGKKGADHAAQSQALIDVAAAYVVLAIQKGIPTYVGTPTTTGGIRIKFYEEGDPAQVYVSTTDDLEIEMPEQLSELFGKEITWQEMCRMVPWLAQAAAELRKPTKRQFPAVDLPQRPQKPAQ